MLAFVEYISMRLLTTDRMSIAIDICISEKNPDLKLSNCITNASIQSFPSTCFKKVGYSTYVLSTYLAGAANWCNKGRFMYY